MAYNYRREYLQANKVLVEKLIDLADRQATGESEFLLAGEATAFQYKVNNLLRSLAVYYPNRAYVRNTIGTTISFRDEHWVVSVGPMGERRKGRRPHMVEVRSAMQGDQLVVEQKLTAENWGEQWFKVELAVKSRPSLKSIIFEVPPPPDVVAWIGKQLDQFGFLISESANRLVLQKTKESTWQPEEQPELPELKPANYLDILANMRKKPDTPSS